MAKGEKGEYEKQRDRERDREKERPESPARSRSRSHSRNYRRRRVSYSPERRHYSRSRVPDKYNRRSRSPGMRYRRKTSRENSAENQGNVLYISNLPRRIRDDDLIDKFSKYGKVANVNVVRDPFTKDSRGFGFITYESSKDTDCALEMISKMEIDGKVINVEISKRSRPHQPTPGVYLGPTSSYYRRRNNSPMERRGYYNNKSRSRSPSNSRSRSRSRSRSYYKNYRRQESCSRSRSRSNSYNRKR